MKVGDVHTFRSPAIGSFRATIVSLDRVRGGMIALVSEIRPLHYNPDAPVYLVTTVFVPRGHRTRKHRRST